MARGVSLNRKRYLESSRRDDWRDEKYEVMRPKERFQSAIKDCLGLFDQLIELFELVLEEERKNDRRY